MARLSLHDDSLPAQMTAWKWNFGDGTSSTEQHPQHAYAKPDRFVVILEVTGPRGTARRSKVWDVQLKN